MFICSVRAATLRFCGVILLSCATLVGVGALSAAAEPASSDVGSVQTVSYTDIRTETDRVRLLESLGYQTVGEAASKTDFVIPQALDTVLLGYNELQKKQGMDLADYAGKKVTRYTYEIAQTGTEGKRYANLVFFRDRLVAADLTSPMPGGTVEPLIADMMPPE